MSKSLSRLGPCARPPWGPRGAHPGNPGPARAKKHFFPRALQPGRGQHRPASPEGSRLLCGSGLAGLGRSPCHRACLGRQVWTCTGGCVRGGGYERGSASRTQETRRQTDRVWKSLKLPCSLLGQRPQGKGRPWGQRGCVETPVTRLPPQGCQWDQDQVRTPPSVLWACLKKVSERSAHPLPQALAF